MSAWLPRCAVFLAAIAALLVGLPAPLAATAPAAADDGEIRALWVDAFHDGFKSQEQVDRLVADARRANVNTLLVQVRRRGDVYYLGGPEPTAADLPAGFDALQALLRAAHEGSPRLEVQAWLPVYPIWGGQALPSNPNHLLYRHGSSASGDANWLLMRDDGQAWTGEGYWLDPGHPAVADYIVDLITDLVQRYDLDGIHLDRVRYFEGDSVGGGVWDRRWGYNPVSVARFNALYGRSGQPDPNDPFWMQFRRDQVTELVRRVRSAALGARPTIKLSAAVVPWGDGPRTESEWTAKAAYSYVFQDWRDWLEQGLLDQAYVMNYSRESVPSQVAWQERWFAWQRSHSYGRQVVAGLALYLNSPQDSVRQIRRALAEGPDGRLAGVALYSYATPSAQGSEEGASMWDLLSRPAPENDFDPPFAEPAAIPPMAWRQAVTR